MDISDSGILRINIPGGVHYTSAKALEAIKEKKEATKARQQAAKRSSSLQAFIERAIENDINESATEIQRLNNLKPRKLIQRERFSYTRSMRRLRAKALHFKK